ncbi:alpha/beta fold hydrolase [Mesorhizobium muleiense]|uniref:Pimeloyl-ACP methyl ester carboxylesterase n=1 Tax=Mesorhizobium muleiense TaxID=1004279 RepID=A0A1G9E7M8_9HYPH|nr:alpha/beta hydrolase [Mesorhizobium muleiense]MCF6103927.1 alpha/beta fold hydrolase [Mesorhizobium muleiense]SDK72097.1 Pimeloyl-ACP methyl ester carboxylesterase [Mesorhizobium muleiense]
MNELVIRADGVELATQSFGNPAQPPILLIMGGMASMLWWPEEFCRRLAARGRFVIRYDQRDSGLSTKYPPGRPGYGFDDAVEDALRVLDGYRITAAHVAGFSQGGMVGLGTALKHPERVLSLTAISTSPVGVDRSSLPESDKAWLEHMAVDVYWSDRAEAVAYCLEDARLIAGTTHPFDKAETRAFIERDFDRSGGYLSATNHSVLFKIGKAWQGRLHEIKAPLLVIHGTADPVFPVEHGAVLAEAVAGARLLKLKGGGHELNPGDWDRIVEAIAEHTGPKRAVDRR